MNTIHESTIPACRLIIAFTMSILPISISAQGPLTPPGAPTPTMKSLDQIEARIIVNAANTPGDATNQFIITAPGSYYLTGNITGVSGKNGISIKGDDVTVDLNGFALIGASGLGEGITVPAAHRNLRIHNGSAQGWGGASIDCDNASNSQFDHLRVSQNGVGGFRCGAGNVLSQISAEANTGGAGIRTGDRCTLTACYAADSGGDGIFTGNSCTVTASTSVSNLNGFNITNQCTIIGCTAVSNTGVGIYPSDNCTIKDCTATLNGTGIDAGGSSRSLIANCAASQNNGDGIRAGYGCLIISNDASSNKNGGAGIETLNTQNRIDSNHCIFNASYGIKSSGATADFIMRNTCFSNFGAVSATATANYSPKSGVFFGTLSNVNDAGVSPWANF